MVKTISQRLIFEHRLFPILFQYNFIIHCLKIDKIPTLSQVTTLVTVFLLFRKPFCVYIFLTGLDIDGRQQAYRQRFLSFERRIRSYILFAKKLHGFNELPKEDQESMFKCKLISLNYEPCVLNKFQWLYKWTSNATKVGDIWSILPLNAI